MFEYHVPVTREARRECKMVLEEVFEFRICFFKNFREQLGFSSVIALCESDPSMSAGCSQHPLLARDRFHNVYHSLLSY